MHRNRFHGTPGEGPGRRPRSEGDGNMDAIEKPIDRRVVGGTELPPPLRGNAPLKIGPHDRMPNDRRDPPITIDNQFRGRR